MTSQDGLGILTERVQNLITRVDVGFSDARLATETARREAAESALEQKRQTELYRTELLGLKEEIRNTKVLLGDLKENFNQHILEDTAIQLKVGEHMNAASLHDARQLGRSEVLTGLDKLLIRGLAISGSLVGLYEGLTKLGAFK